jgi:peptide deformylase
MTNFLQNITGAFKKDDTLTMLTHPHKLLYQPSAEVDIENDDTLDSLIKGLIETMKKHEGVGMAAPQAGIMKRVLIYDISSEGDDPQVLINPSITAYSPEVTTAEEGCLSFPNIYFPVTRPAIITVKAFGKDGSQIHLEDISGLLSRVIQHEHDHLEGIMITDRAKPHIKKAALRAYATYDQQPEQYLTILDDENGENDEHKNAGIGNEGKGRKEVSSASSTKDTSST